MLQSIRDRTHGWIAGTIISILIFSFALWGIHSYLISAGSSNVVAKVNGTEITKSQLAVTYERLRRQLQIQFSANYELPARAEEGLKQRALQTLIDIQVLQQASLSSDYRITSDQIDSFLQGMSEFQVNGEFSLPRFQQVLATTLFTPADYLDLIKTTLLIDQPKLGVIFTAFALPYEVNNSVALIEQQRDIKYIIIPHNYFASTEIVISDADIEAYYNKNQDEFKTPEQASADYILLTVKDLANKVHPTDEAVKSFYSENPNAFVMPASWQLDELTLPLSPAASDEEVKAATAKMAQIVKDASAGKEFATLGKDNDMIKGDAKLKNWSSINEIAPDLQKTVSGLNKLGQVSQPIRTAEGLAIIKVIGYREPQVQPFDKVKDKVREALSRQLAEEQFGDMREKLANLTYEHPDTLQAAAQELGLTVQTTALFTKDKGGKDVSSSTKVREAAFSSDVLIQQNNSDVIQINPESAMVLRIKSHIPATLLSLNTVRQQIIDKLKTARLEEKLSQFANDLASKLQNGSLTAASLTDTYHLKWENPDFIGRHADKIDPAILATTFSMPKPEGSNTTYAATKVADGYAVIGLNAVKDGSLSNDENAKEQYSAFADQIQSAEGTLEYELYKNSIMQNSKIVMEN